MKRNLDDTTLSAFIDGELDSVTAVEVSRLIDGDSRAKKYILNCVLNTALLKSGLNAVLHEEVPQRLVDTIRGDLPADSQRRKIVTNFYRAAAAIVFVLLGYGIAFFDGRGGSNGPLEIAPLLNRYGHVLDAALENNLSGTPGKWQEPGASMTVTVTPVRTYRNAGNQYFREYRLRISNGAGRQDVSGLAYRTDGGRWKTKMLIF